MTMTPYAFDRSIMTDVLKTAMDRRSTALELLRVLRLLERWSVFGRPVVVGALAYDLMSARDIDMEIYCPRIEVGDGFEVLRACARHPAVIGASFLNALDTPDRALYWSLTCRDERDETWKIDMWSAPEDYALPRGEHMVEPMRRALTEETRRVILYLKRCISEDPTLACPSIHLYRAVLRDHVRTPDEWRTWLSENDTDGLCDWKP